MKFDRLTRHILDMAAAQALEMHELIEKWEVSDWLVYGDIPEMFKEYPNAVIAQEIMNSPLYKALDEEK